MDDRREGKAFLKLEVLPRCQACVSKLTSMEWIVLLKDQIAEEGLVQLRVYVKEGPFNEGDPLVSMEFELEPSGKIGINTFKKDGGFYRSAASQNAEEAVKITEWELERFVKHFED